MRKLFLSMVFISVFLVSAQDDNSSSPQIDDDDKISGVTGQVITGLEMAENANKINKGVKTGKQVAERFKDLDGLKALSVEKLKSAINVYKNGRQGIIKFTRDATSKMADIMEFAEKRVNMWRTTLPKLEAYKKNMTKLTDQTSETFKSFKASDLYDIDRKWSRKMEKDLGSIKTVNVNMYNFLYKMGHRKDIFSDYLVNTMMGQFFGTVENKEKTPDFIITSLLSDRVKEQIARTDEGLEAMLAMEEQTEWELYPGIALSKAGQGLGVLDTIMGTAYEETEDGSNKQEDMFNYIRAKLEANATLQDARELQALIRKEAVRIEEDCKEIQRINAYLDAMHTRLRLRPVERKAMQRNAHNKMFEEMTNGGDLPTL